MSLLLRNFALGEPPPYVSHGKGLYLYFEDGRRMLDFTGGFTEHAILGWSHPKVVEAIEKQVRRITHIDYKVYGDRNRDHLAELLLDPARHGLDRVYFCGNSGGEACEAAMKLSYQYFYDTGRAGKTWFLGREQSYHGSTSDALSLNDRENLMFYQPHHPRYRRKIPEHNFFRHAKPGESPGAYAERSARDLEKAILEIGPDKVAGFIGETIQGGLVGATPPSPGYWKAIREICTRYDVHLIVDEVWCGTGTSGKYYCIDYDGITPDFLFMGKTLAAGYAPLSAVLTSSEKESVYLEKQGRVQHSTTHQGYSLGVAAGVAVQEIILEDGFLGEVCKKGNWAREYLESRFKDHPAFRNVRGRGLRLAMEFEVSRQHEFCASLTRNLMDQHDILMSIKWHRVNVTPAITVAWEELEFVLSAFSDEFENLYRKWE